MPRGGLQKLIGEKKKEYGLPDEHFISLETIKSRLKRKRLDHFLRGVSSPLEEAKEVLVQIAISMGNIRQLLTPAEGLLLMNSLIKGKKLQDDLIEFKRRHKMHEWEDKIGEVGRGYW
jgi:hypothetical protein